MVTGSGKGGVQSRAHDDNVPGCSFGISRGLLQEGLVGREGLSKALMSGGQGAGRDI